MKRTAILIILSLALVSFTLGETGSDLHGSWDQLLKKHVKDGAVNYKGFAKDRKMLNSYLEELAAAKTPTFNKQETLAYWINAYNAFTVKLILLNYPVKSIRKISNPWKQKIWKASHDTVSLDYIEHQILRKMGEPRIHFAIVCASIGCPKLQRFAYTPDKLEEQLTTAARDFFASDKHFQLEEKGDNVVIRISKIFSWFGGDFGKKKEWVTFMKPYVNKTVAEKLTKAKSHKFKYLSYDWNLNEGYSLEKGH